MGKSTTTLKVRSTKSIAPGSVKPDLPIATVLGRIGNEPQMKPVGDKLVTEFSLAEDLFTGQRDAENKPIKETIWYKVSVWNGIGERAAALSKGREIVVRGPLKVTPGEKRTFRDIRADVIRITAYLPEAEAQPEEMPS